MSWNLACQAAGVPGLLFHDLRRTAVRHLRRAGVAESMIMKITGHRTRRVFERYNITDQTDTIEAEKTAEEYLSREHSRSVAQIRHKRKRGQTECGKTTDSPEKHKGRRTMWYDSRLSGAERGT
jgi:hypothetical protein